MEDEAEFERDDIGSPANDNHRPEHENGGDADIAPWQRLDRVVLSIARLIGRQIAREQFAALLAANDNTRPTEEAKGQVGQGREEG